MKLRTIAVVAAGVVVLGVIGGAGDAEEPQQRGDRPERRQAAPAAPAAEPAATPAADAGVDQDPTTPRSQGRTSRVTRVVDGDTLELANGQTVRIVGIDTPEVGECGFEKASGAMADLVLDRRVTLTRPGDDRDRYGRLLRYVDVGDVDAGLRLVRDGLAIARYDSRDGYGFHPREPRYVAADRASKDVGCHAVRGFASVPEQSGGDCAPGYSPCIPSYPPDLNCDDVGGPIRVTGTDPHELDGDGDGTACE